MTQTPFTQFQRISSVGGRQQEGVVYIPHITNFISKYIGGINVLSLEIEKKNAPQAHKCTNKQTIPTFSRDYPFTISKDV